MIIKIYLYLVYCNKPNDHYRKEIYLIKKTFLLYFHHSNKLSLPYLKNFSFKNPFFNENEKKMESIDILKFNYHHIMENKKLNKTGYLKDFI
jgi:hypothetical protein